MTLQDLSEVMKGDAEAHLLALRAQAKMQTAISNDLTLRTIVRMLGLPEQDIPLLRSWA